MVNVQVNDPLLGSGNPFNADAQLAELQRMEETLAMRRQQLQQTNQRISQQQASKTPVWDEVEKLMNELNESEYEAVVISEEYKQSIGKVMGILQREEMKMMLPHVEGCKDGKEAIEEHLATIKMLRKGFSKQKEEQMSLFAEYTGHYSDMTYADFLAMKASKKKGGKK